MFRPVQSRRSFEEALEQIVEAIITGELACDDRMPTEREMAEAMGISRPTLREALHILVDAGVVKVGSRSGGTYVCTDVVPKDFLAERRELVIDEVTSVLEARRILETQVAQLAGRVANDDDLGLLAKTIELQRKHADDHDRMLQLDKRFHLEIARASHNPTLLEFVRVILRRIALATDMSPRLPGDSKTEIQLHELTLDALRSRDPAEIDDAMDKHMGYLEKLWAKETRRRRRR